MTTAAGARRLAKRSGQRRPITTISTLFLHCVYSPSISLANVFSSHHHGHHHHHHPEQPTSSPFNALSGFRNPKGGAPSPVPVGAPVPPRDYTATQTPQPLVRTSQLLPTEPQLKLVQVPAQQVQQAFQSSASKTAAAYSAPSQPAPPVVKPKQVVVSDAVLKSVAHLPRLYLGDVVYDPKLKPARKYDGLTGQPPRYPYSSNPRPLPIDKIKDKVNSLLTVKISKIFLEAAIREEITYRRALWGTDIYTDDSDVIAACIHGGWIRGEWPDDVDIDMLSLNEQASGREAAGWRRGASERAASAGMGLFKAQPSPDVLSAPLKEGPVAIPPERDLHVTLLILPTLLKYSATTRFGIRSRDWGGQPHEQHQPHDGMSFKIMKLRWVRNGAGPQSRLRGKARRERIRQAMREVDMSPSGKLSGMFGNEQPGTSRKPDGITGQWWRPIPRKAGSDGDKENRPASPTGRTDGAGTDTPATSKDGSKDTIQAQPSDAPQGAAGIENKAQTADDRAYSSNENGAVSAASQLEKEASSGEIAAEKDASSSGEAQVSAAATAADKDQGQEQPHVAIDDKKAEDPDTAMTEPDVENAVESA